MKKMNKKELLVGVVVGTMLTAGTASFAYQGDPNIQGPNYTPERHEAMTQAFENQDYNAWKELMGDRGGRVKEIVTAENFSKFAEAHKLAQAGDLEGAKEIREELGLGMRDGRGRGQGRGFGRNR